MAHNKTLAAQLCNEFRTFFPDNAVEYFVSLLRLLPARGLRPVQGPLHREGLGDQPGGRPPAPRRDGGALRPPRRDHRRLASRRSSASARRETYDDEHAGPAQARRRRSTATSCCASSSRSSTRATTPRSGRGTFRVRGEALEIFPAYAETAYRATLFGDEVERLQHFDPLTGELIEDDLEHVAIWPATHYNVKEGTIEPRGRGDRARAQRALRRARGRGQAAGVPPPAPAHAVRHGDAARDGLLQRHRELLAHPRRPQARRPALLPARLLPRRLRLLHRRVPPDRAADRRHVRGRPLAQADARRLRLPAAQRAGQPPADLRRVPVDHAADRLRLGDAGRVRARALRARRRADRAPDRASSTRRSRCARRATRSTTS